MAETNPGKLFKASTTSCIITVVLMIMIGAGQLQASLAQSPTLLTCATIQSTLVPCFPFVLGGGPVPTSCCKGVKTLYRKASNTSSRRTVCQCLKKITKNANQVMVKNAETLPGKCGVTLPFVISPRIDCNRVN